MSPCVLSPLRREDLRPHDDTRKRGSPSSKEGLNRELRLLRIMSPIVPAFLVRAGFSTLVPENQFAGRSSGQIPRATLDVCRTHYSRAIILLQP